jgi:hypothetical protein
MRKHPNTDDGLEDSHKGRSNRVSGRDDHSMLGRGHGFGPHTSGRGRDNRTPPDGQGPDVEPRPRNYGRIANTRPGDDGPLMQNESYPPGSMTHAGYGRRSRSMESSTRPSRRAREFDDDLER